MRDLEPFMEVVKAEKEELISRSGVGNLEVLVDILGLIWSHLIHWWSIHWLLVLVGSELDKEVEGGLEIRELFKTLYQTLKRESFASSSLIDNLKKVIHNLKQDP